MFIDGVGDDLISDMTTRIVYDVLAGFTAQMVSQFPSLAVTQVTQEADVWDSASLTWQQKRITLPFVGPHPLLLVPRDWVFWRLLMDPNAFYNRHSTRTVQEERTSQDARGKRLAPSKRSLQEEFPEVKGLNNRQAALYKGEGVDLVAKYRDEVDREYVPLTDAEILQRTEG